MFFFKKKCHVQKGIKMQTRNVHCVEETWLKNELEEKSCALDYLFSFCCCFVLGL